MRPLAIEVLLAVGLAALYWWEVEVRAAYVTQLAPRIGLGAARQAIVASAADLHAMFLAHAILLLLMTVASFIDIDDWIIPDAVTVVGTLVALVLAAAAPCMCCS